MANKAQLKVVGVDPASSQRKGSCSMYCDGNNFFSCKPERLKRLLKKDSLIDSILVCWDSPLLLYSEQDNVADLTFTKRKLEVFLSGKDCPGDENERVNRHNKLKTPLGINTQGFAAVQHWAISQYLLKYPDVASKEQGISSKPFKLITSEAFKPKKPGKFLVEVHPAIAIWWWLEDNPSAKGDNFNGYRYKKNRHNVIDTEPNEMYKCVKRAIGDSMDEIGSDLPDENLITTDGHLDAAVAYILGELWTKSEQVKLVGDRLSGAMLLPSPIQNFWNTFLG